MKNQAWALVLFSIGVFMAALDNGIISAALTTLIYDFGVSPNWGAWSVTIYTLGLAVSIPVVGKLSDRYGRKRLFLIEIFLFGLGSLFVALSPSFEILLVSRLIQSLGGGGIFIIASSHVLSTFPEEKKGRALGALGAMNGIAAVLGPNVGAFILDMTGRWHWLFLINLPIAVALLVSGYFLIRESREAAASSLDYTGVALLSLSILSFMYGITNIGGASVIESLADPEVYVFVAAGLVLFVLLLLFERGVERRNRDPILPIGLMRRPNYLLTLLLGAFSGAILMSVIFIPAYVEQVLGVAASKSGYFFTPLALASGIGAGGGGALVDRKGPIYALVLAGVLSFVGAALFPLWVDQIWQMFVASCILGLGFGIMLGAPLNVLATENAEDNKGIALGTLSLFRQIGMTIGPAIYAGFLTRSFLNVGERIQAELEAGGGAGADAGRWAPGAELLQTMDYRQLLDLAGQIPVPAVREIILDTIRDAASSGYGNLYWSAAVMAALALVTALALSAVRRSPAGSRAAGRAGDRAESQAGDPAEEQAESQAGEPPLPLSP